MWHKSLLVLNVMRLSKSDFHLLTVYARMGVVRFARSEDVDKLIDLLVELDVQSLRSFGDFVELKVNSGLYEND